MTFVSVNFFEILSVSKLSLILRDYWCNLGATCTLHRVVVAVGIKTIVFFLKRFNSSFVMKFS